MANALAIGADKPMIVVFSRLAVAVRAGRVGDGARPRDRPHPVRARPLPDGAADHPAARSARTHPRAGGLPLVAIRSALLEWSRAAELSSDRAATLVNRDPLITCADADGSRRRRRVEAPQHRCVPPAGTGLPRMVIGVGSPLAPDVQLDLTHSYPVRRVAELMEWVRSGEYDRIIGGDYPRRDATPDPREQPARRTTTTASASAEPSRTPASRLDRAIERMAEWLQGRR